jgi:hypothetical protein
MVNDSIEVIVLKDESTEAGVDEPDETLELLLT